MASGQNVMVVPGLVALFGALERGIGHAAVAVRLPPDVSLALDLDLEPGREGVDDGRADAVQSARDRVAAAAELAAGVQHGEHDLDGRLALGLVDVDRDAAPVVDAADSAVGKDRDDDRVAVAGHRLVDRVVDDLLHEVVETARTGRADVHAGALADRLESFEHLDLVGPVVVGDLLGVVDPGSSGTLSGFTDVIGFKRSRSVSGDPDSLPSQRPVMSALRPCDARKSVRTISDVPQP